MGNCYGPYDVSYTPGGSIILFDTGTPITLTGGTTVQIGYHDSYYNGGSGSHITALRIYRNGTYNSAWDVALPPGSTTAQAINFTMPGSGTASYQMYIWTDTNQYGVGFHGLYFSSAECGPPPAPCQYGTRPTGGAATVAFVTDAAIAAACTLFGAPWLAVALAPLIGYAIDSGVLCGSGPPAMPTLAPTSLTGAIGDRLAMLNAAMWFSLCECTPGTPAPIPYTPAPPAQPPWWPTSPTYTCDPANVCASLMLILKRLDELSNATSITVDLTTALQRFGKPFAYVQGAVHNGLTGSGTIAVSRLAGVRFSITAGLPERRLEGTPPYIWNVGWMSVSDGGAMLQEHRFAQQSFEWFPDSMQLATTFGYYLQPGVTAQMVELKPEN